jgi:phosphatidylserine decarboxylase
MRVNFLATLRQIAASEDINFLLTNRIPRQLATRFIGWFSRIENPLVRDLSLATWRVFADLDLRDAKRTRFQSLHDCFTRELVEGARPPDCDPKVITSPSDGIVGACGQIEDGLLFQAKGMPYTIEELFAGSPRRHEFREGSYITLRLTSGMYHRFHAPHDLHVEQVDYISGDTWNVNPIALARVERLFCRNERALIHAHLASTGLPVTLVPVAAILVASIRLHFLDVLLHLRYRGPNHIACDAHLRKGEEMGWFQHGSTILVFVPRGVEPCEGITPGARVRAGQALLRVA